MNIISIPNISIEKPSKILTYQHDAGYDNSMIDLSVLISSSTLEYREKILDKNGMNPIVETAFNPDKLSQLVKLYLKQCKELKLEHTIGRAPYLDAKSTREDLAWVIYKLTCESIHICSDAGCKYIIIEPVNVNDLSDDGIEANIEFYKSFMSLAKEKNIQILIRNQYSLLNGNMIRGVFAEAHRLNEFVNRLNEIAGYEQFGICLDIGTANLCNQKVIELVKVWGDKIKTVWLKENNGQTDNSCIPFTMANQGRSQMDWISIIRGLREIEYDYDLIYDYSTSQSAITHLLRQDLINYSKKIIDYLAWQLSIEKTIKKYSSRVLFGAGNMCRNYMKCYGKEYKPLFTCDNNSKIWGTTFEGLEIKNPEALKDIPKECAIFICNMYYDEIESQLREMGVANPIERFSDEFLPSMYTDRFDSKTREVR